jgi:AraC-like DNA-binding protein
MLPARRVKRELVTADAASSLSVEEYRCSHYPFQWHHHPECELSLIVAGRGRRMVGDGVEAFGPGDIVLIGPGLPHSWASDPADGHCQAVVVKFAEELVSGSGSPSPEQNALRPLLARARRGLAFTGDDILLVASKLRALAQEDSPPARLGYLFIALGRLAAGCSAQELSGAPVAAGSDRLGQILARMHDGAQGPLTQAAVAEDVGITAPALSRLMQRRLGKGFVRYLAELRIAAACRLLAEGNLRILDAALASGFESLASFNRWFRRLRGSSPREYRRMARDLASDD